MAGTFKALSVTRGADGVCEILLTRPELLNRFDNLLQRELASALEQTNGDEAVRSIVLGATGKVFSAGGDFALMEAAHDDEEDWWHGWPRFDASAGRSPRHSTPGAHRSPKPRA
jgi:enoyl-CoA hydratase